MLEDALGQPRRYFRGGNKIRLLARICRNRNRGNALKSRLECCGNCSGIIDVITQIESPIHTGNYQVRLLLDNLQTAQDHAIRRRTVHRIAIGPATPISQRLMQRDAMTGRAHFTIRRDCHDIAQCCERFFQRGDAGRIDAVVVREQNGGLHISGGGNTNKGTGTEDVSVPVPLFITESFY